MAKVAQQQNSKINYSIHIDPTLPDSQLLSFPEGWKLVADSLPQLVWILDQNGVPEYYNQRWYDFSGKTSFADLARSMNDLVYVDDRLKVSEAWQKSLKSGQPVEITFRMTDPKTGDLWWYLGRGVPLRDAVGKITHWLGTSTDIHTQKLAQEHQHYLSESSRILASSLDYDKTLKSVAKVLVPEMADWFSIDLAKPEGDWESAIVSHVDPKKVEWVKSLGKRFPHDPNARSGTAAVLRTGKTEFFPEIPQELIEAVSTNDEIRDIINQIGFTSIITAPLKVRDRVIGALSLVSAESGRRYTPDDVRLAESLADMVAIAIDNARLYQARKTELELRKQAEAETRQLNRTLEKRVLERTESLEQSNRDLLWQIEERRKVEAELNRQAKLLNLAHEAILTRDIQGHIRYWNEGAARLYGYSRDEVLGQTVKQVLKSVYPVPFKTIEAILKRDNYWEGEIVHTCKSGERITIYSHWTLQRNSEDDTLEILEINIDVTRQKENEQQLVASERRFAMAVASMQEGVVLQDADGIVQLANQAAQEIWGLPMESLLGRRMSEVEFVVVDEEGQAFPLERRPSVLALKTGVRQHGVMMGIKRASGQVSWVSVNATPLLAAEEKAPSGVLVTLTDVTERRRLEQERQVYAVELERSNRELQDFASVASHDLQEPLRKVQAFGDRLQQGYGKELGETGADYLNRMQLAAERMQRLINDLLTYSRVTTRAQPFEAVSINQIASEVVSDLEVAIGVDGGKVTVGKLPQIEADPMQMRQLLQNLIGNGLKFHKPGEPPSVEVDGRVVTQQGQKLCELTVKDNGIGMDPKYYDRIFQMFQRLHSREDYSGTGVGLAVARKIVDRHHGSIMVDSAPGKGSTFHIFLPIKQTKGGVE